MNVQRDWLIPKVKNNFLCMNNKDFREREIHEDTYINGVEVIQSAVFLYHFQVGKYEGKSFSFFPFSLFSSSFFFLGES